MGASKLHFLTAVSALVLMGCETTDISRKDKAQSFNTAYNSRGTTTSLPSSSEAVFNASQSRLNVYARDYCRFADTDLQTALKSTETQAESGIMAYAAAKAAEIGVNALTTLLKSAGQDRLEETPINTSFAFKPGSSPLCIEISKNSESSGQFIVELGVHHSDTKGVFRIVPIYLNYFNKSKSYLLNGGKRTIAVKLTFADIGATNTAEILINLGDWKEGDVAYFNRGVTEPQEFNLASNWLNLNTPADTVKKPINLNVVFMETTSGNKIAKLLGEELEENQAAVTSFFERTLNPEDIKDTAELEAFRKLWEPKVCAPTYEFMAALTSGAGYSSAQFDDLKVKLDESVKDLSKLIPEKLVNAERYRGFELNKTAYYMGTQLHNADTLKIATDTLKQNLEIVCLTPTPS